MVIFNSDKLPEGMFDMFAELDQHIPSWRPKCGLTTTCLIHSRPGSAHIPKSSGLSWFFIDFPMTEAAILGYPLVNIQKTMENHHF